MAVHTLVPIPNVPQVVPSRQKETQITQAQLIHVIALRNRVATLKAELEAAESKVQEALESGAMIEAGIHVASLKESLRRSVAWREIAERLADRLYSRKGAAYCENVLQNTHPSKTFSLVVS